MTRSTKDVFYDHLEKRKAGDLEGDIATNYATDVIFLTGTGVFRGHQGVRDCAQELAYYTNNADFSYEHTLVEQNYAFLEWTADGNGKIVSDGADSFVVKDGKIILQTIHFSANDKREQSHE